VRLHRHRTRRKISWELIVCGVRGHVLIGTGAAELRRQDALFAHQNGGIRWHRCLRCDGWLPVAAPAEPTEPHPPERAQIELPLRGRALRDKIVLRVIAVDRALHFLILGTLGIAVLILAAHEKAAHGEFERVLAALQGGVAGGPVQTTGHVGIIGDLDKLFSLRAHTLRVVGAALLAYAVLEGIEAVGLWLVKRWAEYLTFLATSVLLPFEVYEIVHRISVLKLIGFAFNVAIVIYLVYAKRLFGLRGGGRVDEAERALDSSWEAVARATPRELAPLA
jgi:uncharacterized membrane protein (DUF2068 family)